MCDMKKQKDRLLKKIHNFREDLTCSICKDIFNDPVTLECLHSFCKDCYTTLFRFSKDSNQIQCPLCKKDMKRRSFLSNTDIEIAIEAVKKYTEIIDKYWKNEGEKSFIKENKENTSPTKKVKNRKTPKKPSAKKTPLKVPEYHALPVHKNLRKTRSLDCIITKEKAKKKRHSIGNVSNIAEKEKIMIDEFNSQNGFKIFNHIKKTDTGKKIINLLEEDCLANLENEFGNKSGKVLKTSLKNTALINNGKQKRKKRESSFNKSSSDNSEGGWSRMKTTKKNIEPKGKKLKQLNISTFSANENNKKDHTGNNINKSRIKSNKYSTRKHIDGKITNGLSDSSPVKERASFKLDQFEAYLQENLEDINNPPVNEIKNIIETSELEMKSNKSFNIEKKNNGNKSIQLTRKSLRRKNTKDEIGSNYKSHITTYTNDASNDTPSKKLRKNSISTVEKNLVLNDIISEEKNQKCCQNDPQTITEHESDIIFQLSTQKLNKVTPNLSVEENITNDDVFSMPTQRLSLEINGPYFENNIEMINNDDPFHSKNLELNFNENLEQITICSAKRSTKCNNNVASDISSVYNIDNIVVEAQVHRSANDSSYIKLPDILNDNEHITSNTIENNKEKNQINNKNMSCLQELTTLQNDLIKNNNIVQELFTILSNSKSLFSTISQEKLEKNEFTKNDHILTNKVFPTLFHDSNVVNFYNNAVPYLNNLKKLYFDFSTSIKEITVNTKKLSEIFGQNTDAINTLILNKEKNSTLPSTISINDANLSFTKIVQRVDNFTQTDSLLKCPKCEYIIDSDLHELNNLTETNKNKTDIMNISSMRQIEENLSNNFIDIDEGILENKVNRKLEYNDKKYKRIRKQSSDSESEPNIQKKPKFVGLEKYDNKDINIVFLSELTENFSESQSKIDLKEKNQLNKNELELQKLLDKYRKDTKSKTEQLENANKDDTQDYALKYMLLLEKDYKELNFSNQKNNKNNSPEINQQNITESKKIEHNKVMDHSLTDSMFINTLTVASKSNNRGESQFSKSLFTESEKINKTLSNNHFNKVYDKNKCSMSMFTDNKLSHNHEKNYLENNQQVLNLSPKDIFDDKELDDEVACHLSNSIIDDSLDENDIDVFDNIDIVDSTPQKDKPIRSFRELQKSRFEHLYKDSDNIMSDINFENTDLLHIAPPPEFQDIEEQNKIILGPKSNTPNFLSLSPDPTNKQILNKNIETQKSESHKSFEISQLKDSEKNEISHNVTESHLERNFSNVSSFKNESFIRRPSNKNVNPLTLVQKDSISPLTIMKNITHIPKTVISSTPKQKTILNYMSNTPSKTCNKNDSIISSNSICLAPYVLHTTNVSFDDKMDLTPVKGTQITEHNTQKKLTCIACTRLNRDETLKIIELTNKLNLSYSNKFSNEITHLVVSVDDRNRVKDHTMKYVSSVANGIWVLSFAWIQECLAHNTIVSEEPYEVLDVTGIPGPKRSRLTRKTNLLFKDFAFYCAEPFSSVTKNDLEIVITNLGGQVTSKLNDLTLLKDKKCLILTEAKISQDFDQYQNWLEDIRIITVDIEWLSRVVGQYQISSVRPFMLCLDEGIETIGYPSSLIAVVPDNFGDTTEINE